jgi:hypothetical protein
VICVPANPIVTDRVTVIAAMRTCGPQLTRSCPAALYGSLPALSPSKWKRPLQSFVERVHATMRAINDLARNNDCEDHEIRL